MTAFSETGFLIVPKAFNQPALHRFEARIVELYREAANRCGIDAGGPENFGVLAALLEAMETEHKTDAYLVQKLIETDLELKELFHDTFFRMASCLLGRPGLTSDLRTHNLCLFINRPRTQRLLAKWHSERHYYPNLKEFVNVHFPLFCDKTKENGAMSVVPGSHLVDWTFNGYSPGENAIYQKEISEDQLKGYQSQVVEERRGDLCFFHANLVHKSNENLSDKYSFAAVCRVYAS